MEDVDWPVEEPDAMRGSDDNDVTSCSAVEGGEQVLRVCHSGGGEERGEEGREGRRRGEEREGEE